MPIKIHGKDYFTVIERVNMLRNSHPDHSITTKIITADAPNVIMRAKIKDINGRTVATGHAEEVRGSTMINKTSALENCETSAIGRALASFGLGGTEFASANEVENAIYQQDNQQVCPEPVNQQHVQSAYEAFKEVIDADVDEMDYKRVQAGYARLSNDERISVNKLFGKDKPEGAKKQYTSIIKELLKMSPADTDNPDNVAVLA